jgi:hypothetical protein
MQLTAIFNCVNQTHFRNCFVARQSHKTISNSKHSIFNEVYYSFKAGLMPTTALEFHLQAVGQPVCSQRCHLRHLYLL